MDNKQKRFFTIANISSALFAGGSIYYLSSAEVIFVRYIDSFVGTGDHPPGSVAQEGGFRVLRCYLPDMLWGYSLVFALFMAVGYEYARLTKIFFIAWVFSLAIECIQLSAFIPGTFDLFDLVTETAAELVAVFIINNRYRRVSLHEKTELFSTDRVPGSFWNDGIRQRLKQQFKDEGHRKNG